MKFLKTWFFSATLLSVSLAATAADKNDIYIEGFSGLDLEPEHRILMGTTVGYCPWDEIGVGVSFEQVMATKSRDDMDSSLRAAIEFRWFLEPWEFWLDTGYLRTALRSKVIQTSGSVNFGGGYLFAISPSMAIRAGTHIQFPLPYTADGLIFLTAALRVLW
jgi:hypothetical protein